MKMCQNIIFAYIISYENETQLISITTTSKNPDVLYSHSEYHDEVC